MNLLIVDDELYVVRAIRSKIDWKQIGIDEVFVAFNAQKAREIFLNETVDIIITDVEMPIESGLELMEWVRAQGFETKAICLTCHADFEYAKWALRLGFSEYYVKPVDFEKLQSLVARVAEDIRKEQALQAVSARGELWENNRDVIERHFWEEVLFGSLAGRAEEIVRDAGRNEIVCAFDGVYNVPVFRVRKVLERREAWESQRSLMEFVMVNIAAELLAPGGSCGKIGWHGDYLWVVTDVSDADTLLSQIQEFIDTCHQTVGVGIVGYIQADGGYVECLADIFRAAVAADTKNVTCSEGIMDSMTAKPPRTLLKEHFKDNLTLWHEMLANVNFDAFYEACAMELTEDNLNREALIAFIGNVNQAVITWLFERGLNASVLMESERQQYRLLPGCRLGGQYAGMAASGHRRVEKAGFRGGGGKSDHKYIEKIYPRAFG